MSTLLEKITTSLAQFSSASRLYSLNLSGDQDGLSSGGLLVARDVIAVATKAPIDLNALLGRAAGVELSLAGLTRSSCK